jgi:hypothetical protein
MADIVLREPASTGWKPALVYTGISLGIGAVFGALTNPSCDKEGSGILCGAGKGAVFGAYSGLVLAGIIGLGVAVVSAKQRDTAIKVAGIGLGIPLAIGIFNQLKR